MMDNKPFEAVERLVKCDEDPTTMKSFLDDFESLQFFRTDDYTRHWVYILVKWKQVVYVWYSAFPMYRVATHKARWEKDFDKYMVKYFDTQEESLLVELTLIYELLTVHNREIITPSQYKKAKSTLCKKYKHGNTRW